MREGAEGGGEACTGCGGAMLRQSRHVVCCNLHSSRYVFESQRYQDRYLSLLSLIQNVLTLRQNFDNVVNEDNFSRVRIT